MTQQLHRLELLLEAKGIEAEIARDPARLITDEELEWQIAEKVARTVAHEAHFEKYRGSNANHHTQRTDRL